jgi:hypothetical protein
MLSCSNIAGPETGLTPTNQPYSFGGNALIHQERDRRGLVASPMWLVRVVALVFPNLLRGR